MVNLADLPNAAALAGTETLPMQQGSGAVKVTANQLLSRAAGQVIPVEIGGTRIATITGTGVGIGSTNPETGLAVRGDTPEKARIRIEGTGSGNGSSLDLFSNGAVFRIRGGALGDGLGVAFEQVGIGQRAKIDNNGYFVIGPGNANTSNSDKTHGITNRPEGRIKICGNAALMDWHRTDSDGVVVNIIRGTSAVGSITVTASSTAYNTTSDYRLPWKKGHVPLTGSGEFIDSLDPRYFPEVGHAGFIAHEFAEASPSSVTGEKDAVDEDGNPVYQQMDASSPDVMANIIAELQSLRQRVAALEAAT